MDYLLLIPLKAKSINVENSSTELTQRQGRHKFLVLWLQDFKCLYLFLSLFLGIWLPRMLYFEVARDSSVNIYEKL